MVVALTTACLLLATPLVGTARERGADAVVLLDGAKQADITIELNAGNLWIAGGTMATGTLVGGSELLRGRFDTEAGTPPEISYDVSADGQTGRLIIGSQAGQAAWSWSAHEAAWRFYLNPTIPTNLDIEVGTGNTELILGGLLVDELSLSSGSGDVVLDLSGDWRQNMQAVVDMGAGDLTILVPRGIGVRISANHGTGDLVADTFSDTADGLVNAAYGRSTSSIELSIDIGAGNVSIVEV